MMTIYDFMRLWRKTVAAEDETPIYIELPDGSLCSVADLYGVEDDDKELIKLVIAAGQEVV